MPHSARVCPRRLFLLRSPRYRVRPSLCLRAEVNPFFPVSPPALGSSLHHSLPSLFVSLSNAIYAAYLRAATLADSGCPSPTPPIAYRHAGPFAPFSTAPTDISFALPHASPPVTDRRRCQSTLSFQNFPLSVPKSGALSFGRVRFRLPRRVDETSARLSLLRYFCLLMNDMFEDSNKINRR